MRRPRRRRLLRVAPPLRARRGPAWLPLGFRSGGAVGVGAIGIAIGLARSVSGPARRAVCAGATGPVLGVCSLARRSSSIFERRPQYCDGARDLGRVARRDPRRPREGDIYFYMRGLRALLKSPPGVRRGQSIPRDRSAPSVMPVTCGVCCGTLGTLLGQLQLGRYPGLPPRGYQRVSDR